MDMESIGTGKRPSFFSLLLLENCLGVMFKVHTSLSTFLLIGVTLQETAMRSGITASLFLLPGPAESLYILYIRYSFSERGFYRD